MKVYRNHVQTFTSCSQILVCYNTTKCHETAACSGTVLSFSVAHLSRLRVLGAFLDLEFQTQQADTALINMKLRARLITPKGSGEHQPCLHSLLSNDTVQLYVPYMLLCMSWHRHGPPIRVLTGVQACRSCCLCTIFKSLHQAKDVQTLQALLHFCVNSSHSSPADVHIELSSGFN